ncbi:hypothetical protein CYMTET_3172 [Cymbomonas tetramitiformis]|uniref:Glycosyl transferase family 1 domain-containing protein n=1 Tax=Cymbomonas tetramitiformis TaxID=36881 RepID=A0AAE0H483_9CHLO|nr:hypothetical protein CYMTET_3172 [Cymbomonas tetramitiformis]
MYIYIHMVCDVHQNITAALEQCDCIVVPSIWNENSPLVIHEAQQARKPVVTSGKGGMGELVKDQINGITFTHRDQKSLENALQFSHARGALAVAVICHSRRRSLPPQKKSGPLPDAFTLGGPEGRARARASTCKEARCAWTRCTRCALPPGTMRLVCLAGQRRVTQPETAQRELLPHGGAPGALAVAAICHSRRALCPPKEKRSAPGRFTLGVPKGRARVSTSVCSPRGDTHARVDLHARA